MVCRPPGAVTGGAFTSSLGLAIISPLSDALSIATFLLVQGSPCRGHSSVGLEVARESFEVQLDGGGRGTCDEMIDSIGRCNQEQERARIVRELGLHGPVQDVVLGARAPRN